MQALNLMNKGRPLRRTESTSPSASAQGERPEARQWTCINKLHWRSVSKGARAYRAPSVAGIAWSEVIRRTTRDASSHEVLDDIHPVRDSIGEAAACTRFGGSRDIQTDIYIDSDDHIDYDDTYADQTQQWSEQSMVGTPYSALSREAVPLNQRHLAPIGDKPLTHTQKSRYHNGKQGAQK